jgi:hypothetical protein
MFEGIIEEKIQIFLEKEVLENDVNFNEVEIGMKLQKSEQTNKLSPYYYLRVQGKFKRYIKVSELL